MSNEIIYDIIKNKDYTIRPFLFRIIKENKLNTNEILLLIYLSNQEHPELDLELINNITTLTPSEILEAFTTLTSKNLISTKITKDGTKVIEEITLENTYKIAATNINKTKQKQKEKNIFEIFENEFARPLSPMEIEFIDGWIKSGKDEEIIIEALKEATYNGVNNLRYIDKIVYEWNKKGYKTVNDVRNNKYKKEEKDNIKEIFDYNWLDENE